MSTRKTEYTCGSCGYVTGKWMGFCPQCRQADSLVESRPSVGAATLSAVTLPEARSAAESAPRLVTGMGEIDRVLGGGAVPGGVVLVGGDPGIGKSTLLLQMAASLSAHRGVVYVTGEESVAQVADRAIRLGVDAPGLVIAAERDVDTVAAAIRKGEHAAFVIDSIQTMTCDDVDGGAGGVSQLREASARLIAAAKDSGVAVFLVGHVTKDGALAGPRQVEHMVDVVLHLDGDDSSGFRCLRGVKNRYGSIDRLGVFEMAETGMVPVTEPTALLGATRRGAPGSVMFPAVHGRRALLLEVQALVAPSAATNPRRSVRGLETARVHQVVAVLERHCGLRFGDRDVFVSVVGGLRVSDPAIDLPVAMALVSSLTEVPVPDVVAFGEVGLTGEIRPGLRTDARIEEAARLGGVTAVHAGVAGTIAEALTEVGLARSGEVVRLRRERS